MSSAIVGSDELRLDEPESTDMKGGALLPPNADSTVESGFADEKPDAVTY